jgi:hypothetical protein
LQQPYAAAGIPISTHLYPEVAAHVMRVTETAHWLGGLLEKYSAVVGQANKGAVTHSGAVDWPMDPIPEVQR